MKSDVQIIGNTLRLIRTFHAPRERVFSYWKRPELLERWSGCNDSTKVEVQSDFRVGGTFTQKLYIHGAGEHTIRGTYEEIVEPERIVYRVNLGPATTTVTVEFFAEGNRTRVVLTQVGFPDEMLSKIVSQGTQDSFEKLDQLLQSAVV